MTLELFTAIGALVGGSIAFLLDERLLSVLFAGLLVYVAITMLAGRRGRPRPARPAPRSAGRRCDDGRPRRRRRDAAADGRPS